LDKFPSLFAKIAPEIQIRLGDQPPFTIAIRDLEDFHPDKLFASLEFFAPMRELRRQLQDPKTFALAAAMVGSIGSVAVAKPAEAAPTAGEIAAHGEDLQRLLGRPSTPEAPALKPASAVDGMIREAVAPYVVGKADPRQADLIAAVDGMTSELMRAVLHDPGFQQVEAVWRGLDRLIRTLELDEMLQVFVLDVSRAELTEDFSAASGLAETALYGIVVDRVGDKPWSLLVDCNTYGRGQEDATLLARLGTLAQEVEAAVVAGMDWSKFSAGFASREDERAWAALRNSTAATSIGMALPSILLRLPYGKAPTRPTDSCSRSRPLRLRRGATCGVRRPWWSRSFSGSRSPARAVGILPLATNRPSTTCPPMSPSRTANRCKPPVRKPGCRNRRSTP
jgi:type VI secretion system protein ImpC